MENEFLLNFDKRFMLNFDKEFIDFDKEFLLNFHADHWKKLSLEEKKQVLEQLEKMAAEHQDERKPCKIRLFEINANVAAYHRDETIYFNKILLEHKNFYESVFTALHEGVHAWQRLHVMKNPDQYRHCDWFEPIKKNAKTYLVSKTEDRLFQPMEQQADYYAFKQIVNIYKKLSEIGRDDPGFWEYFKRKIEKRNWDLKFLKNRLGENYMDRILKKLDYKRDLLDQLKRDNPRAALLQGAVEYYIHQADYGNRDINLDGFKSYFDDLLRRNRLTSFEEYIEKEVKKIHVHNVVTKHLLELNQSSRYSNKRASEKKLTNEVDDMLER